LVSIVKYYNNNNSNSNNNNNNIIMWSCPGNMPKYYPGMRDTLPDRR